MLLMIMEHIILMRASDILHFAYVRAACVFKFNHLRGIEIVEHYFDHDAKHIHLAGTLIMSAGCFEYMNCNANYACTCAAWVAAFCHAV